ncbi:uncharacterized protein LY89DRAFT_459337 [Mollisia scopiformis]|uniref:Uncharacterized protein n=1 Tax=Mollisia scopiformis TaxID=149040 RepID=A0A194XHU3_MOLSC|nr:uncharacterized protein LY89DRAFT_459337 [Mollisia scopiformis]KUJ19728.1 hypothetical protein LY89DRAFT_459337 [Mollisia scopiformis]
MLLTTGCRPVLPCSALCYGSLVPSAHKFSDPPPPSSLQLIMHPAHSAPSTSGFYDANVPTELNDSSFLPDQLTHPSTMNTTASAHHPQDDFTTLHLPSTIEASTPGLSAIQAANNAQADHTLLLLHEEPQQRRKRNRSSRKHNGTQLIYSQRRSSVYLLSSTGHAHPYPMHIKDADLEDTPAHGQDQVVQLHLIQVQVGDCSSVEHDLIGIGAQFSQ